MELIIDCVWCSTRKDFMKFTKTCEEYTNVIDYFAISNKLSKSDINGQEPTDSVIGLYIMKRLQQCLREDEECLDDTIELKKILYLIKNLKSTNILALKELIASLYKDKYSFNLIIINRDDFPKKGVLSLFDSVKFIDN